MENDNFYSDIAKRTNGDIYIGVVGPVRTGKSTFIQRFMDTVVIPNIDDESKKGRAVDELPQSAAGRTIMTTEPKFIPEQAVKIKVDKSAEFSVRLIDCVGYIVPSALGYIEDDMPRMVMSPWYEEAIPFNMAAEIGTKKVITEHSTIGLVVTTDGTISDLPREEYEDAEERVINELKGINKPFVVLLNSVSPSSESTITLAKTLQKKYSVSVLPVNCLEIDKEQITQILKQVLFEFPIHSIDIMMPKWLCELEKDNWLRNSVFGAIHTSTQSLDKIKDIAPMTDKMCECDYITTCNSSDIDLGTGNAVVSVQLQENLFYKILGEKTGVEIGDEGQLLNCMLNFVNIQKQFEKLRTAYQDVQTNGYGIVMPDISELSLEEPQIIKQGGKYGIRLKASAPAIHMMKTNIATEITPIVGSEAQSQELVNFLLKQFEENPADIWNSNIFGKNLHELVNEGLHNKLERMPEDARKKLRETIERIINDGCNGLICIIL